MPECPICKKWMGPIGEEPKPQIAAFAPAEVEPPTAEPDTTPDTPGDTPHPAIEELPATNVETEPEKADTVADENTQETAAEANPAVSPERRPNGHKLECTCPFCKGADAKAAQEATE